MAEMRLIDANALDFTPEHNGEAVVFNGVAFVGRSAGKSMGAFAKVLKLWDELHKDKKGRCMEHHLWCEPDGFCHMGAKMDGGEA